MKESEFKMLQEKEWVDVCCSFPTSLLKVLVCYLDSKQNPVVTTAFYVRPQQIPQSDKDFKGAVCEEYFGRMWVKSGFYEKLQTSYPVRIEANVIAWQPLPRRAVWMVRDLMKAKQIHNRNPENN